MAKKFRFRLEQVLDLRKNEANEARLRFSEAEGARIRKEEEIVELRQYYDATVAKSRQEKTSVQLLESQWYHVRAIQSQITMLERERVQLVEIEEVKRRELAEAMTKQRVLEKLKDNKREQYNRQVDLEEQKFMDDIAQRTGRVPFQ